MSQSTYQKSSNHNRRNIIIAALILLVLAGGIAFAYYRQHQTQPPARRPVNSTSYAKPNPQDSNASNSNKTGSNSTTLNNTSSAAQKGSTAPTASQTNTISVKIVSLINNGSIVHVGTIIDGTTSGTCTLVATQGTQTVDLGTTPVESSNSTSCGAFNVPLSSFPAKGNWTMTVTVTSGNSSTSNSGTVTI